MQSPQHVFEGNERLSQEFLAYVSSTAKDPAALGLVVKAIRNAPVDIRAYFHEQGDLDGLTAPGIGKATKVKLLPLLTHGLETALKMNATSVDLPLDKARFQDEARAAVNRHREEIKEGE